MVDFSAPPPDDDEEGPALDSSRDLRARGSGIGGVSGGGATSVPAASGGHKLSLSTMGPPPGKGTVKGGAAGGAQKNVGNSGIPSGAHTASQAPSGAQSGASAAPTVPVAPEKLPEELLAALPTELRGTKATAAVERARTAASGGLRTASGAATPAVVILAAGVIRRGCTATRGVRVALRTCMGVDTRTRVVIDQHWLDGAVSGRAESQGGRTRDRESSDRAERTRELECTRFRVLRRESQNRRLLQRELRPRYRCARLLIPA